MAVTGLIWIGYVIIHIWGNMKVYQGPEAFNHYAGELRYLGAPVLGYYQGIWLARIVLLLALIGHVWSAFSLWSIARSGRPDDYQVYNRIQPAHVYASYTMRWGGVLILLFVIFHILHFTMGSVGYGIGNGAFMHPIDAGASHQYFAYENLVNGFRVVPISLFYIAAMIALGFHLYHGAWSIFQTIGWNNQRTTGFWRSVAMLLAVVITLSAISIPVAVLTGIVY
jgi:succinate dehydrogenase / fumarate reductase cytochrome b subunit